MVAAVILAAGLSRRLGQPKQLLPFEGRSLIRRTTEQVIAAGESQWEEVVVVLGHEAAKVQQELKGLAIRTVFNPRFAMGMSASLIAGLQAVIPQAEGAMIFLGDQPIVSTEIIQSMLTRYRKSHKSIIVPAYGGVRGNPVLFSRSVFSELMDLEGDRGGREVVMRDPKRVETVAFPSDFAPQDVDTWEDYETLTSAFNRARG
ncbi:MAG: nucleotidyltransferase family protein [Nitrospirae bacterium]|nr:nucleotidyltransferase family protein [Candidatus Manganitrophaceae bacterium]